MRALIVSDVHANHTALEAVLADAEPVDRIWCLGDVVGYGPDPNECVERLRALPHLSCILGNHDAAVAGLIPLDTFNPEARSSILWTRSVLSVQNIAWLAALPECIVEENVTLAHGSPRNPVWEYILDPSAAALSFDFFDTDVCFVGHTHLPIAYTRNGQSKPARWDIPLHTEEFRLKGKCIINPGSTGQPRDRDPRAAYGIFDTQEKLWYPRRAAYNIFEVQDRIRALSLPIRLAVRLAEGW
jgi:predicted phosphodiesterase